MNVGVVTLTWYELLQAAITGAMRRIESLKSNVSDKFGYPNEEDNWSREIEGAAAEMAYAKFRNKYWSASINTYQKAADVGRVQVRSSAHENGSLIVRPHDKDEDIYVLLIGKAPTFRVVGWQRGIEAKKSEWQRSPNGVHPAFFVPQSALMRFGENGVPVNHH